MEDGLMSVSISENLVKDSDIDDLIDFLDANKSGLTAQNWTDLVKQAQNDKSKLNQMLIWASSVGQLDGVNQLIAAGADCSAVAIDVGSNTTGKHSDTALTLAAKNGHVEVVRALLNAGANVNQTDKNGLTPLMKAAYRGHSRVIVALLADSSCNLALVDNEGKTAYDYAVEYNNSHPNDKVHDMLVRSLKPQAAPTPAPVEVQEEPSPNANALRKALQQTPRNLEDIHKVMQRLNNADVTAVLAEQGMAQRYFSAAYEYYSAKPEGSNDPRNKELAKTFERLKELQVYVDSNGTGKKPSGVDSPDAARVKLREILEGVQQNADLWDNLSEQDKRAIGFIAENSKPKDKAQELRNAIIDDGLAGNILKVIESTDDEIIRTVLAEKGVGARYCNAFVDRHAATPEVSAQYKALSELYQELDSETDESKRKEIQTKIAGVLQSLSSANGLEPGEKKVITLLQSVYQHPESHVINGGIPKGVNIPQGQPVVNPVQDGIAMAQAKSEEEKTPWYKQEWIWWVLGIALAGALGFFAFRKGGWLNKDDKKTATVNTNTNDNSNSNTNTNDGNESGGTLDNSAQNITSADLNNMLATGGRISRSSTDRS